MKRISKQKMIRIDELAEKTYKIYIDSKEKLEFNKDNLLKSINSRIGIVQDDVSRIINLFDPVNTKESNFYKLLSIETLKKDEESIKKASIMFEQIEEAKYDIQEMRESCNFRDLQYQIMEILKDREEIIRITEQEDLKTKEDIVKDIISINENFDNFKFIKRGFSFETKEKVVFFNDHNDEIDLGRFRIHLRFFLAPHYNKITIQTIKVTPLEPNPSVSKPGFFHPHVQGNGVICLGEGSQILDKFARQFDFFEICNTIQTILNTYNPDSPYAPLHTWKGSKCSCCGEYKKYLYICGKCKDMVCTDCICLTQNTTPSMCKTCTIEIEEEDKKTTCDGCKKKVDESELTKCTECDLAFCKECITSQEKVTTCVDCGEIFCSDCRIRCCISNVYSHNKCMEMNTLTGYLSRKGL
jgi:hypothetical protein